ncbi:arginase family protein [Commensalibacter sp. M0355]|uniref:arginase family protein n=1 Tax=Commensalibacter sp. M0355 TaxID=2750978 RepID=UPI00351C2995
MHQLKATQKIIDEHEPDRIITFGGTCIVSQAPFAYLNKHYNGKIGLLWIDSHPDISTPKHFDREHAMILGNLLGKGDPYLANEVRLAFKANQVLIIGIHNYNNAYEKKLYMI